MAATLTRRESLVTREQRAAKLQAALLAFHRLTERFEGLPPTVDEFREELGLKSKPTAALWLNRLEEAGLIYCPAALKGMDHRTARTRKLSAKGLQRAYLLTEAVA